MVEQQPGVAFVVVMGSVGLPCIIVVLPWQAPMLRVRVGCVARRQQDWHSVRLTCGGPLGHSPIPKTEVNGGEKVIMYSRLPHNTYTDPPIVPHIR